MNDLRFAFRQVLMNLAFTVRAMPFQEPVRSLPCFFRAVARRDFETRDQKDIHDLVVIRFVMSVKQHFTAARSQRDVIFVLHQQPASIRHMNDKRAKGPFVKQLPDFIRFHVCKDSQACVSGKERKAVESAGTRFADSGQAAIQMHPSHL